MQISLVPLILFVDARRALDLPAPLPTGSADEIAAGIYALTVAVAETERKKHSFGQ